jgi:hypothetical protein
MIKVEAGGRNEGGVWEKTYLQQRNKVSKCMVKIGQEALTWRAEMKRLLWLTAGKGVSSKKNGTVWEKNRSPNTAQFGRRKKSPNTTLINKTAVNSIYYP